MHSQGCSKGMWALGPLPQPLLFLLGTGHTPCPWAGAGGSSPASPACRLIPPLNQLELLRNLKSKSGLTFRSVEGLTAAWGVRPSSWGPAAHGHSAGAGHPHMERPWDLVMPNAGHRGWGGLVERIVAHVKSPEWGRAAEGGQCWPPQRRVHAPEPANAT